MPQSENNSKNIVALKIKNSTRINQIDFKNNFLKKIFFFFDLFKNDLSN